MVHLGENSLRWVKLLYSAPRACIQIKDRQRTKMYDTLWGSHLEAFATSSTKGWEKDLGPLQEESWQHILVHVETISLPPKLRRYQLFVISRTYYASLKLFKWGRRESPICMRCQGDPAYFIHIVWRCPK